MESQQPVNDLQPFLGEMSVELLNLFDQMSAIRAFLFNIDGVLTNNEVQVTESGELLRTINTRDSQAIRWAIEAGFSVGVITSGRSEGIRTLLHNLGVVDYDGGATNKAEVFAAYLRRTGLDVRQVCFMGDDLPDIPVLRRVIFATCPADAVPEVKALCDFISPKPGGAGCARDLIERVLKAQGKWPEY